jgi:hypothetical protein
MARRKVESPPRFNPNSLGAAQPRAEPTKQDRIRQLERLLLIVQLARDLTQDVQEFLPVRGKAWAYRIRPDAVDEVINSAVRLEKAVNPDAGQPTADLRKGRLDAYKMMGEGRWWTKLVIAFQGLLDNYDEVLRHYGWGPRVVRCSTKSPGWKWPKVPPIRQDLIDSMNAAARTATKPVRRYIRLLSAAPQRTAPDPKDPVARMRKAIQDTPNGANLSPNRLIKVARINNQRGKEALRILQESGEYHGHKR